MGIGDTLENTVSVPLRRFLQELADIILSGDLAEAPDYYVYPLVVFSQGRIRIESGPEDTIHRLEVMRTEMARMGGTQVNVTIEDVLTGENGRSNVVAIRTLKDGDGRTIRRSRLRYFCSYDPERNRWQIEMLELLELFSIAH